MAPVHGARSQFFDSASLYFRAFHGIPTTLKAPSGQPVNAVRGLLDFLATFLRQYSPEYVACCWDNDWRPDWRVDLVATYKAHRVAYGDVEEVPDELTPQVPIIREVLDAVGLPVVGADRYEADDILATLAERAPGPSDIVTGDRDLFQLVDDDRGRRVLYVARGVRNHEQVTDGWLGAKYGIVGAQYVDFAVIRGDASDGLPGVKGVGEKTAASLLARYGDMEGILAAVGELSPAVSRALSSQVDYIARASEVVSCARDVALPDADLRRPREPLHPKRLSRLQREYNLGGSVDRLVDALRDDPPRG